MPTSMTKILLTLMLLLSVGLLLGACHTTAGAGKDLSQAGQAIENSANRHAP